MFQTSNFITVVVYAISVVLHSFGFALLTRIKKTDTFGETQRLYLLNLSLTSAIYAGLAVFEEVYLAYSELSDSLLPVTLILDGFLYTWYIFIMTALTFDRFLTLYLKLRYIYVWNIRKTIAMLAACCTASVTIAVVLYMTHSKIDTLLTTLTLFVWPFLDFTFLFVAFFTYSYLLKTFRSNNVGIIVPAKKSVGHTHHSHETAAACNHNSLETASFSLKKARRGFIVPSLLVSSFVVCWLIPDLIYFGCELSGDHVTYSHIVDWMYPFGVLSDAIIYILCWKDTRRALVKLIYCR